MQTKIINDLIKMFGSLAEASRSLKIPYRTLQDWKAGKRKMGRFSLDFIKNYLKSQTR
jgi:hypothetical protein